ncbi:MAG: TlpA family protein disulfide reductase [Flavobacteriaceae bacterium]|nr:TlpA family protein disulfide reductase [Flavobacteriaceae bacterium]
MKKFLLLIIAFVLFSCKNEPKDYVSFQGKITNSDSEILTIMGKKFKKDIKINKDGTFKDTLKVTDGFHGFNDASKQSIIYLRNGYDVILNFDSNDFPNSIQFEGEGASTNNYLTKKLQFVKNEKLDNYKSVFELDKDTFDNRMMEVSQKLDDLLVEFDDVDPEVLKLEKENNIKLIEFYQSNYKKENANYTAFKKGMPSPKFNYPDTNGKNVSLDDFKGKYVYIDVWATWCGPCKREIPFLKKLDEEYKDTDLVILSMSIDKMEHKDKWLKMVKDEQLQGVQIMADKDWNSTFVRAYNIQGIPRFILIDKEGNIYDANAPRPSNPNLKKLLNSLDL